MVVFSTGKYCGVVNEMYAADNVLAGIACYTNAMGTSPLHYHSNAHLSLVLNGKMQVRRKTLIGDARGIETMSFIHAGEAHQTTVVSQACRNINLEFDGVFFANYNITEAMVAKAFNKPGSGASQLMARLYRELNIRDENFANSINMLVLEAVAICKRGTTQMPAWLAKVKELLHDKWDDNITLQEIAAVVNIHPVTISRYFTSYFGVSLGEYRRRLKIERAIAALSATDKPLTQIAYDCGFFDQSHFIRAFKSQTGMLPKHVRRHS